MVNFGRMILFWIFGIVLGSCSGVTARDYEESTRDLMRAYRASNFKGAYRIADNLVKFNKEEQGQDYYLSLLERGKVAIAKGDYRRAIRDLQRAEKHFLKIEGTFSISEESGALFANELGKEYEVEPHEMILISPYLALSYLLKGDFNGAKVERNRTINKINNYIEERAKNHLENPFARYISGLIYELEGKMDDARIEYRKMRKYSEHLKTASYMEEELRNLGDRSPQLVIILETGVSPYKYEKKYGPLPIPINKTLVTIAFAYARLRRAGSLVRDCRVLVGGEGVGRMNLLYNLERTVMDQHQRTEGKRVGNLVKRVAAKQLVSVGAQAAGQEVAGVGGALLHLGGAIFGVATAFMERADLRSWRTLSRRIYFLRFRGLELGRKSIEVRCIGGSMKREVEIGENRKNWVYMNFPG